MRARLDRLALLTSNKMNGPIVGVAPEKLDGCTICALCVVAVKIRLVDWFEWGLHIVWW
jgi:hypothetical protein